MMIYSILKTAILILMVASGLFFYANIYVFGNTQASSCHAQRFGFH